MFREHVWEYEGYDPDQERLRETLCTLGNGFFATRGAAPECTANELHYPGTYVAGCYDRLVSRVAGRRVENEDIVNLPNWLPLRFRLFGPQGALPWFTPDSSSLLTYKQTLDLRTGTLERRMRHRSPDGCVLAVRQIRLVHMGDAHLAALRTEFTAEGGWSGDIEVEAALDGSVTNTGVARYRQLAGNHLVHVRAGTSWPGIRWLSCRTSTSDIRVGLAATLSVTGTPPEEILSAHEPKRAVHSVRLPLAPGEPRTVDKVVALHTSRDPAISDPLSAAIDRARLAPDFSSLLKTHVTAWSQLWRSAELDVPGEAGRILGMHLFHVLQSISPHSADMDVGVPARGLHGEAYRGHVFWDELFVLPYMNLHFPEVSRAMLMYRYRRLGRACRTAREGNRAGAQYPWQSGSDGREEAQMLHLNPLSGHWIPDHSRLQYHVGSAIAYNVLQYCEASGDTDFLHTKGAEMLTQIARFWASFATWDKGCDHYRITGVMGPDEYHDAYPGSTAVGLDDNAYTNVLAAWVLARSLEVLQELPEPRREELRERTDLDDEELSRWEDVSRRLFVPFHDGVISQFHGFGDLDELDWGGYRKRYGDIRRLDRILEEEGDTVNRYQASKQADALMLGYLFSASELQGILRRLGYELDDATWNRTVHYYLRRTSHGSTLSGLVHGWVLSRAHQKEAWTYVREALKSDIANLYGGSTAEGIHLGAMGGTLDLVQRGLTGLETRDGALWLDPVPLRPLSVYGVGLRYRGHWGIRLGIEPGRLQVSVPDSDESPVDVQLPDRAVSVEPGDNIFLHTPWH